MSPHSVCRYCSRMLTLLCCGLLLLGTALPADAKKKAAGPDPAASADAELKKTLDPLSQDLGKLMVKIQAHALFSPDEAAKLADLKYKLVDMVTQFPANALIAKPLYQAGMIFTDREAYNDAYELFGYLVQGFPTSPYGAQAKLQMQQMEKRLGPEYFTVSPVATTASPSAASTTSPATPKK